MPHEQERPNPVDAYLYFAELVEVADTALGEQAERVKQRWRRTRWRRCWQAVAGCYALVVGLSLSGSIDTLCEMWDNGDVADALHVRVVKWLVALLPFLGYVAVARRGATPDEQRPFRHRGTVLYVMGTGALSVMNGVVLAQSEPDVRLTYVIMESLGLFAAGALLGLALAAVAGLVFRSPDIALYVDGLLQPAHVRPAAGTEAVRAVVQRIRERDWEESIVDLIVGVTSAELQSAEVLHSFLEVFLNLLPAAMTPLTLLLFTAYVTLVTGSQGVEFFTKELDTPRLLALAIAGFYVLLTTSLQIVCAKIRQAEILRVIQTACALCERAKRGNSPRRRPRGSLTHTLWEAMKALLSTLRRRHPEEV